MSSIKILSLYLILLSIMSCAAENTTHDKVVIAVNTDSRIGYYIDCQGTYLFNKQFDYVSSFAGKYARVKENGKWGVINSSGVMVVPCIYDGVRRLSNGYTIVENNDKHGFLDYKGEIVTPLMFDDVRDFSNELAWVMISGKWGVVNKRG